MRVYILDDEKPARGLLRFYLEEMADIQIIGESGKPVPAIEEINSLKPDLVFLDIDMPVLNGFEVLPYLKNKPIIIFCTAFDQYAVKAFEVNALDYLVKPPTKDRLVLALQRAGKEWHKLNQLKDGDGKRNYLRKIVCNTSGSKYQVVWTKDIMFFTKDDPFVILHTQDDKEFLTQLNIGALSEQLDPDIFFQVSRGQIVNQDYIESFSATTAGQWLVHLVNGETLTVSRRRVREFKQWFNQDT